MFTHLETIDNAKTTVRTLTKTDGTQIRLTATMCPRLGGHGMDVDIFADARPGADQPWARVSDRPHPDWRAMSVQAYVERGRSQLLQLLGSPGQLLALSRHVHKRWQAMAEADQAAATYSVT